MERRMLLNFIIAAALFAAIVFLLLANSGVKQCDSLNCLVEAADSCTPAQGDITQNGLILEISVSQDCMLNAKVVSIVETEPQTIQDLFIGRFMKCSRPALTYMDVLSFNDLSSCEGPLKDAMYEMALVQQEAS